MSGPSGVLVVDDSVDIVALLERALSRRGFSVAGISDPRDAGATVRSFLPDVCVLDVSMPQVSGAEVLEIIRAIDQTIEVVLLTGERDTALAVDLMRRGASDFLQKPVNPDAVARAIGRAAEHRRLVLENNAYRDGLETRVAEQTRALNQALCELTTVHAATMDSLALALDFRDPDLVEPALAYLGARWQPAPTSTAVVTTDGAAVWQRS